MLKDLCVQDNDVKFKKTSFRSCTCEVFQPPLLTVAAALAKRSSQTARSGTRHSAAVQRPSDGWCIDLFRILEVLKFTSNRKVINYQIKIKSSGSYIKIPSGTCHRPTAGNRYTETRQPSKFYVSLLYMYLFRFFRFLTTLNIILYKFN